MIDFRDCDCCEGTSSQKPFAVNPLITTACLIGRRPGIFVRGFAIGSRVGTVILLLSIFWNPLKVDPLNLVPGTPPGVDCFEDEKL